MREIYFDNAATSRYKPDGVFEEIEYSLLHSANSGRSGHKDAVDAAIKIENCRTYLLEKLGGKNCNLVFTKNCTEALNLAIFGFVKRGMRVVTTANEHNSVLRPLFKLFKDGEIELSIVEQEDDGTVSMKGLKSALKNADLCVIGAVSNVTGATVDLSYVSEICKFNGTKLIVDGAQGVPIVEINAEKSGIDMLAVPGHKGLHGVQGTGFLLFDKSIKLSPMMYGGTGTRSNSVTPPTEAPESYEAGTQFGGGIAALYEGAKWSFGNRQKNAEIIKRLGDEVRQFLLTLNAEVYTKDATAGVISFNLKNADSGTVADAYSENLVAVRGGLHCAPLTHKFLGTTERGAVRVSLGADNTERDVYDFIARTEIIMSKLN